MNYTLKVVRIKRETEDTVTLCFKQPGLKKIKYLPGQYLTLIFRINGRRYIRPYSFSSCPVVDDLLEITVKRVQNGTVSNHINDKVQEGDSIEVLQPMGEFVYIHNSDIKNIYLWGVGSGITPLISIAKHILHSHKEVVVNLIYGNRNHESTIFMNQITELANKFELFKVWHFHTRLAINFNNPNYIEGRIDQRKALDILNSGEGIFSSSHYICGPQGLKESVKLALSQFGVQMDSVFSEEFELVKDPKDFIDIVSRTVKIGFEGKQYELEVVKGKTILEAALDADIELPYSCQTGNCSTCKGKLVQGASKMIGLNKVREDLKHDEYLLCCTHPLTENVYIEI